MVMMAMGMMVVVVIMMMVMVVVVMMMMVTLHQLGVLCLNIWQGNSGAKEPPTTTSRRGWTRFAKTWRPRRR